MKLVTATMLFAMLVGIGAVAQGYTKIHLTWTDSTTAGAQYNVYRATALAGPYTKLTSTPLAAGTAAYDDLTPVASQNNYYFVTAIIGTNESVQSQGSPPVCFNCVMLPVSGLGAQQQ